MQPDTVPDSSDSAGSGVAKSYRQNFCAVLPGKAAAVLPVCAGEFYTPHKSAYYQDLRYLYAALILQYRLMYISPVPLKTWF